MDEALFALVSDYGLGVIFGSCFLSCLLVPIPSSLIMLAGGAFVAAGDLVAWQVMAAAYAGAVLGDNTGFRIGHWAGARLSRLAKGHPGRADLLARGETLIETRGGVGVFLSTWAVAPLGPYVNMIAGAARMGWGRFALWDAAGEAIWVTAYVGMGWAFATQITWAADILSSLSGFAAAGVVALLLGWRLLHVLRNHRDAP